METTVTIKDNRLVISIPMQTPSPSASGKTLLVASTRGPFHSTVEVEGKAVTISVNAYIKK